MIEHSIFALPFAYIAALTAMWQQTRSVHWVDLLLITIAMVSARTVAMAANRILDRELRRAQPADGAARTGDRRDVGPGGRRRDGRRARRLSRQRRAALLAVPAARSDRGVRARPVLLRQAVHRFPAGAARARPVRGAGRSVARRHRFGVGRGGRARSRSRHLDRWVRPHLLLPGRRGRPSDRLPVVPRPLRRAGGAVGLRVRSPGNVRGVRVVRRRRGPRLVVVDGTRARGRGAGLRARDRACGRPVAGQPSLLHRERVIGIGLFGFALADLVVHGLAA